LDELICETLAHNAKHITYIRDLTLSVLPFCAVSTHDERDSELGVLVVMKHRKTTSNVIDAAVTATW
jgi:hypothetical protein